MNDHEFDFIIVGAGPAGSALAFRLTNGNASAKVLLVEAGGLNNDPSARFVFDRYSTVATYSDYVRPYSTAPQKSLDDRVLVFPRGKGLGGSSAVNFSAYTIGPRDDYDEWARLANDDSLNWNNVKRRYVELETYHDDASGDLKRLAKAADWHGKHGPLHVGIPETWSSSISKSIQAAADGDIGLPLNPDINSGNPLGVGISPNTALKNMRFTAAAAFLEPSPANLQIKTDSPIAKILFDGKRAIGVQLVNGDKYTCSKEVIVSCGALDSPKLLLLSGVGPESELTRHGIPVVHDLPGVGKNLVDHCGVLLGIEQKSGTDEYAELCANPLALSDARAQFNADRIGPFASLLATMTMGFGKDESTLETHEFKALPKDVQEFIQKPTVPTWELISSIPLCISIFQPELDPATPTTIMLPVIMNPQSRGTVTLASSNPMDHPVCDPNFLSHPFDRVNIMKAMRKVLTLMESPAIAEITAKQLLAPASNSDEDIWEFSKKGLMSIAHMSGTCKMGVPDDESAVVTSDFKVRGLEGLRVADMSVIPFVPNCHTVSWAYIIGWTLGEKMIKEYKWSPKVDG